MKYAVIGAGGTGGALGGYLTRAGKDVTLIARGAHLAAMQDHGLQFETMTGAFTIPVTGCTMEEYQDTPDVVFVCVKGYSLEETVPFLARIAGPETVVIPVLNLYGTGGRLQQRLPGTFVTDGCIYISSEIKEPGTLLMCGTIFRVVFGLRRDTDAAAREKWTPVLEQVRRDLEESGMEAKLSPQIEVDAFEKFSFVSPMAAAGAYYDVPSAAMQQEGEVRSTVIALMKEIKALSEAMEIPLPEDVVERNIKVLDALGPQSTASMQRDLRAGRQSEVDGLLFEVVRLGERYGVPVPAYERIAAKFRK